MRDVDRDLGKPRNPEYYEPVGKFDVDENSDLERWRYPGGTVELSIATGRVTAFENKDGTLKVQGVSPETEESKAQRRAAAAAAPTPTHSPALSTAQGCVIC